MKQKSEKKPEIYRNRIANILAQNGKKSISYKDLYNKCSGRKPDQQIFNIVINEMVADGTVYEYKHTRRNGKGKIARNEVTGYVLTEAMGYEAATVSRINRTFGFLKCDDGTEVFVPGKFLKGALPEDRVIFKDLPRAERRGESREGEVIRIISDGSPEFSGTVEKIKGRFYVRPDRLTKDLIEVSSFKVKAEAGTKVLCEISKRGERHADHRCCVTAIFGDASKASSSAVAVLHMNGIETEFPNAVMDEARRIGAMSIAQEEINRRLDLRDQIIFTIDGADTKDIDDAVSVSKTADGWKLGVHIADVSHYVKSGSELDKDAFLRGTSIYYADKVIPMLPKELSNGICSLNPQEDRLAFSCLMELDADGNVVKFKFSKTVIRSRVKGVYKEINEILGCHDDNKEIPTELLEKYDGLFDTIYDMRELAAILTANKIKRGAPQIDTPESLIILDENDVCIDVKKRERGTTQVIIEEFMLMANSCAAKLARENHIPFVYRVHEDPAPEKIEELHEVITRLDLPFPKFTSVKPAHLAQILESAKDKSYYILVNNMVLRSMAKAKYADVPLGHFGLVLSDYAHFTSPIRRYPDLSIHRILTDLCYNKDSAEIINKRYAAFAKESSMHSSECELTAMRVERDCEDCYIAEFMSEHLGEEFTGIISSMTDFGFYVELPNTVEGLVRIETLRNGTYDFDGHFSYSVMGKTVYKVGDTVKVTLAKADIASGKIDFVIAEEE